MPHKTRSPFRFAAATILLALAAMPIPSGRAHAASVTYDGVTFPEGNISFADAVVDYTPDFQGGNTPTVPNATDPEEALGSPDFSFSTLEGAVALGDGGRITLEFLNNVLTGSGDSSPDLHIFEIGIGVEDTFVEISTDGSTFIGVGEVTGGTSSIDIDAFGFDAFDEFRFVRLTDDFGVEGTSDPTVGADIDAVGAISTSPSAPSSIPTPAALPAGLVMLMVAALRRRRAVARCKGDVGKE